ncbi:MAG: hypothetical protein HY332_05230 [Chloroflexi bacterium]|nr:hypothetical protein [Chloroflexota bacterium]
MLPSHHAGLAAAATVPLAWRGWNGPARLEFFAAAVLIDADHYLSYVWRTGDLSLWNAYWWHRRRTHASPRRWKLHWPHLGFQPTRPLHVPAALLLFLLVSWRWRRLRPLAWGLIFHRALDALWEALAQPGHLPCPDVKRET